MSAATKIPRPGQQTFRFVVVWLLIFGSNPKASAAVLGYHTIRNDGQGMILPWFNEDPALSFDNGLRLVWSFWNGLGLDRGGVKYYLTHQVWKPTGDGRGLGGDQLSMAMSSWSLFYGYSGIQAVQADMVLMADHWLAHGLSAAGFAWPHLPFPYNTNVTTGVYDGDMKAGKDVLQPDKAGSFAAELIDLYEITGQQRYLAAAVAIADTLVAKMDTGSATKSPWPFRVNARTNVVVSAYSSNWTGALRTFEGLIRLATGSVARYAAARVLVIDWMKKFPLTTHNFGPFFEDVGGDSNTEINADTLAWHILSAPNNWGPTWQADARGLLDWSKATFGNQSWSGLGVTAINEQTAYPVPGNSHTARHASIEVMYAERSKDKSRLPGAIRQLIWATYMVDVDGKNRYPQDDIWLTDGYGDYVRHYLRAMAANPVLSPRGQDHLLRSTRPVRSISYSMNRIAYQTVERKADDVLRISFDPDVVSADGRRLPRLSRTADLETNDGYVFNDADDVPGVLRLHGEKVSTIEIAKGTIASEGPRDAAPRALPADARETYDLASPDATEIVDLPPPPDAAGFARVDAISPPPPADRSTHEAGMTRDAAGCSCKLGRGRSPGGLLLMMGVSASWAMGWARRRRAQPAVG